MATPDNRREPIVRPSKIGFRDWLTIARDMRHESKYHDMPTAAAAISFLAIVGVLSTVSSFVAFYGVFASPDAVVSNWQRASGFVPTDTLLAIIRQMNGIAAQPAAALVSTGVFSLAIAVWCAQQGMSTLITALNRAYYVATPQEPWLHFVKSFWVATEVLLVLAFTAFLVIGTPLIASRTAGHTPAAELVRNAGLVLGGLILAAGLSALYRYIPDRTRPAWRWVRPGAILVVCFWALASTLFSIFLSYWNSYTAMYGSMSALLIFVTLTYVATFSLLLGAVLNAQIERYRPDE